MSCPPPAAAAADVNDDSPTLAEVARRLSEVVTELREMRREIAEDRQRLEARFLPRSEFDLAQQNDAIQLGGLEREVHSLSKRMDTGEDRRRQDRALLLGSLAFPLLVALIGALLLAGGL